MGLDNIPYKYPCKTQGTAILDEDERIDCDATQACGQCPWKNHFADDAGVIYGMLGTSCWYRGKAGNGLLHDMGIDDDDLNFYGDNEDGTYKSPKSCDELADVMEQSIDKLSNKEDTTFALYAIKWLRWVASECGGSTAWY